jgi:thiaminase
MVAFTDRLIEANRAVWAAMAGHPFVLGLAHGTLPDSALQAWVQQDRVFVVEERRVLATLRAHGLPSRLDGLLADLDRSLVLEAEAFTQTATEHGFAPDAEPWPICLGYTSYLRCAAHDGTLEGLTALYAAERAYLDTWTAVATLSPADSTYHAWIQNWSGEAFRGFVSTLGHDLDELAGTPSPALTGRLGVVFTGAARFELAFWEMCWSGQAWPG